MTTLPVDMGHTVISKTKGHRLVAFGLGACVGVCVYDPLSQVGGMVHIVLPRTLVSANHSKQDGDSILLGKFADTAVAHLIAECIRFGANPERLQCAIAGGASVFQSIPRVNKPLADGPNNKSGSRLEIGRRNVEAVRNFAEELKLSIVAEDIGGTWGRTLTMVAGTGEVYVRAVGSEDRLLANLAISAEGKTIPVEGQRFA